ncbi:MAG: hypothetical protein JNL08_19905 [Planctomycetes bacterium]|nr:hypothetical protein [Planctomycetota bacterium]
MRLSASTLLALCAVTPAQDPAPLGSGPLLCYVVVDEGVHRLTAVELEPPGTPRELCRSPAPVRVLQRLDRDHLLLSTGDALVLLDAAAGAMQALLATTADRFVAVHGDDVLVLGDARGEAPWLPDNHLYAVPWRGTAPRRRIGAERFATVPIVAGNLAIALDASERELWAISLNRLQERRLTTLPDGDHSARVALSPDGARLAIGSVAQNGRGRLRVVDAATGRSQQQWDDLPIGLSPLSSFAPTLEVAWHDATHVVCSESRGDTRGLDGSFVHVRRDVGTGAIVDETVYSGLELYHRLPQPELPSTGLTVATLDDTLELRRLGTDAALRSVPRSGKTAADLVAAPDGRFAAACRLVDGTFRLELWTADPAAAPRDLGPGRAEGWAWLEASR